MGCTFFRFALLSFFLLKENAISADKAPYIVYLGKPPLLLSGIRQELQRTKVAKSHSELLGSILGTQKAAQDAIIYSYTQHINGFAAKIDKETADLTAKLPGVVSVFPSRGYQLHTTRSWQFLGLESDGYVNSNSLWSKAGYGKDTIIGNLDTGVWPESQSFADDGMAAVPTEWKGICDNEFDASFTCNKKLIGARYFNKGYEAVVGPLNISYQTPHDSVGHGTHTLSTADGAFVANTSLFGYGSGTAKGGSPHARVVAYKDSSEIEEESTNLDTTRMRPCTGRISLYSTADTTHDSTSQTHRNTTRVSLCTGRVGIVPETERFRNSLNLGIGALKGAFLVPEGKLDRGELKGSLEEQKKSLEKRREAKRRKLACGSPSPLRTS